MPSTSSVVRVFLVLDPSTGDLAYSPVPTRVISASALKDAPAGRLGVLKRQFCRPLTCCPCTANVKERRRQLVLQVPQDAHGALSGVRPVRHRPGVEERRRTTCLGRLRL